MHIKEVQLYYSKKTCPRCNSKLGKIFNLKRPLPQEDYWSIAYCEQDDDHYSCALSWEDPKYLKEDFESITVFDDQYKYFIKTFDVNDNALFNNQIIIQSLENEYDEKEYLFSDLKLNFKWSDKRLLKKIKTLMLFR